MPYPWSQDFWYQESLPSSHDVGLGVGEAAVTYFPAVTEIQLTLSKGTATVSARLGVVEVGIVRHLGLPEYGGMHQNRCPDSVRLHRPHVGAGQRARIAVVV